MANVSNAFASSDAADAASLAVQRMRARYKGHALLQRAIHVAQQSSPQNSSALRFALELVQSTTNVEMYGEVLRIAFEKGMSVQKDAQWIRNANMKYYDTLQKLTTKLEEAKRQGSRAVVMEVGIEIAEWLMRRGEVNQAIASLMETREGCASLEEKMHVGTVLCTVCYQGGASGPLTVVSNGIFLTVGSDQFPLELAKISACVGLQQIRLSLFSEALRNLTRAAELMLRLGEDFVDFPDLLLKEDLALYICFCAIFVHSRAELKTLAKHNSVFQKALFQHARMRNVVDYFCKSKFLKAMNTIEELVPMLRLDVVVAAHVTNFVVAFRSKCIVMYIKPYAVVDLAVMSRAFNTETAVLETLIADLIQKKKLDMRIDRAHSLLLGADSGEDAVEASSVKCNVMLRQWKSTLLYMSMVKSNTRVEGEIMGGDEEPSEDEASERELMDSLDLKTL